MEPLTFVLFGATGDLAQRKIIPALFELYKKQSIPTGSQILVFSRRLWTDQEYMDFIKQSVVVSDSDMSIYTDFLNSMQYISGTFDSVDGYAKLKQIITHQHIIVHLAVPPNAHIPIIKNLHTVGIKGKILIEKPFGHNLESAKQLESELEKYVEYKNIYRIDHYLGKKGLDQMLIQKSADTSLVLKLHKDNISSIHFRLIESIDIQGRGGFYDTVGAFLDVGQNHVLSMVSSFFVENIRIRNVCGARAQVLNSLEVITTHRGQYRGYVDEQSVQPQSQTETYFKIELMYTHKDWAGIPLFLESGKALKEKKSDIVIRFKDDSVYVFDIEQPKKPDAYEVVLGAAIVGDDSRFVCIDEMMESWRLADEIRERMKKTDLCIYDKGVDVDMIAK